MTSNFLGDAGEPASGAWRGIISANELSSREGVNLQKGMNYRKEPQLSVFLVLPTKSGEYRDVWIEEQQLYIYEGHDSTTVESGKQKDHMLMYESGRLSDNGKFYKAANEYKDGIRREPLQVQIYEKLDPGVWFDKGIFNLIDAKNVIENGRKVFKFFLRPADALVNHSEWDRPGRAGYRAERFLPAGVKAGVWATAAGRCEVCGAESDLHFRGAPGSVHLQCSLHSAEA